MIRITPSMNTARVIAGGGSFALTVLVFVMMWANPTLANNDLFKSLGQAVVIQGLIGLVMAFLFTGNSRQPEPIHVPAPETVADAADVVAGAAVDAATDIKGTPAP